jgi:hypothetical protein
MTTTSSSTACVAKISMFARNKLGLIDSDDDLGEEISVDDKYNNYMMLSRHAYAEVSVLTL